jgi:beta-hydroxylase
MFIYYLLLFVSIILIVIFFIKSSEDNKLNDNFYDYTKVYPTISDINNPTILNEMYSNLSSNISNNEWLDWPENYLYQNEEINGDWKIIPFYGFGIWCKKNCAKFPNLTKFLESIPNLKIALISKLNPNTKLIPHYGWCSHSNNVLRCHYGILLPKDLTKSYISVSNDDGLTEEIQYHKLNDWIVFDDSKLHYAENKSNEQRVVLIVDIERPYNIKRGTSSVEETSELMDIINQMKIINDTN